ncbi:movement protein [Cactus tobamovirus 2]|nr:movement protein [Cactus tobamovirus 2]UPI40907.1 movement protein [Cactus tobamovirus 2]
MSLSVQDPSVHLRASNFIKFSLSDKFKASFHPTSVGLVHILSSDVVKVASCKPVATPIKLFSDLQDVAAKFKYVYILAALFTGRWHIKDNCPGSALVILRDRRLLNSPSSVYGGFVSKVSVGKFQVRFRIGHSLTTNDLMKDPLSLLTSMNNVPICEGSEPLSIEFSTVLFFTNHILEESLGTRLLSTPPLVSDTKSDVLSQDDVMSIYDSVYPTESPLSIACDRKFLKKKFYKRGKWYGPIKDFVVTDEVTNVPSKRLNHGKLHKHQAIGLRLQDKVVGEPYGNAELFRRRERVSIPDPTSAHATPGSTEGCARLWSDGHNQIPREYISGEHNDWTIPNNMVGTDSSM